MKVSIGNLGFLRESVAIETPNILPGESGYIPKKERTAAKKIAEKKSNRLAQKKETTIGKIKTGSKGYRIGKPSTTIKQEKKYLIWRYGRNIGEIFVKNKDTPKEEITMKFIRLGGMGNYRHLIQDADFRMKWAVREQELLLTQKTCFICEKKLSKSSTPFLYHTKMWQKRAQLLEMAEKVPDDVVSGKLTVEQGWKKFNDILEEGNRYYMSLKDTVLICSTCAKKKGLVY